MSKSLRNLVGLLLPGLLASCGDDNKAAFGGVGGLEVEVAVDNSLHDPLTGAVVTDVMPYVPVMSEIGLSVESAVGAYARVWPSLSDFPQDQDYFQGLYYVDAFFGRNAEGFEAPCYAGSATPEVKPGESTSCRVEMKLQSSAFTFSPALPADYASVKLIFHTPGHEYHEFGAAEQRILYLTTGSTEVFLDIEMADGRHTCIKALGLSASAASLYDCVLSAECDSGADQVLHLQVSGEEEKAYVLDDALFASQAPVISHDGWNLDATLMVPEGEMPVDRTVARVTASEPLRHLYLSTSSVYLSSRLFPKQLDLMNLTEGESALISGLGLEWAATEAGAEVDFSNLIGNLVYLTPDDALSVFSLIAEDAHGVISNPLMLRVRTTEVDISLSSVSKATVGATEAELFVSTTATGFDQHVAIELMDGDGRWQETGIRLISQRPDGMYLLRFAIPEGNADVKARILYCEEVRAEFTVERSMPEFTIEVDAFATYALLRISAADAAVTGAVVRNLMPYVDGRRGAVLMRDEDKGLILLSGLEPRKTYRLTASMMDRPDTSDFTKEQKFTTESDPSLPNGDFEERDAGVSYSGLPSGGRYSQTIVPIFNWQNSESFSLQKPSKWANTNSKTFCSKATNHNTWYMQPSVFTVRDDVQSGEFAVCLRSVAFDLGGEEIPDYTQKGQPYLDYSPIVPHVAWRAAGKIFLGEYSFSASGMEEIYNDVVNWTSRPSTLNGFYKYTPSLDKPSDAGVAIVEVYGEIYGRREVIASAKTYLPVANGYTAFSARLTYKYFGVKAKGLKVMFASSSTVGSVAEETSGIVTGPDPIKGASLGSTLWLDNVSFAY